MVRGKRMTKKGVLLGAEERIGVYEALRAVTGKRGISIP